MILCCCLGQYFQSTGNSVARVFGMAFTTVLCILSFVLDAIYYVFNHVGCGTDWVLEQVRADCLNE